MALGYDVQQNGLGLGLYYLIRFIVTSALKKPSIGCVFQAAMCNRTKSCFKLLSFKNDFPDPEIQAELDHELLQPVKP